MVVLLSVATAVAMVRRCAHRDVDFPMARCRDCGLTDDLQARFTS
jgi:hypothetical protein